VDSSRERARALSYVRGPGASGFLPSGNTALTRRATKYSPLRAVVVQWARARNRYERQGILVTAEALRCAEEECLADADVRERRRLRDAERRDAQEPAYRAAVNEAIRAQFPACPTGGSGANRGLDVREAFRKSRALGRG